MDKINFYSTHGDHGCFSNFYRCKVCFDDLDWETSEHAFQAQKYKGVNPSRYTAVRKVQGPMKAAEMGRDRRHAIRRDWEAVKDNLMYEIVLAKFSQHEDLKKILLDTGDAVLVEHTANDSYWGDGGNGSGKNMLGKTLMRVRKHLGAK